jgi:hypothetical protein
MYDQAWHSLSNEKKLILPSSTLGHNWKFFLLALLSFYAVRTYAPFLELVLYYTVVHTTTSWQIVFWTDISLSIEKYSFEGQFDHDRRFSNRKLWFLRQLRMRTRLTTAPLKTRQQAAPLNTRQRAKVNPTTPSLLRSAVNRGTRITPFKNSLKRSQRLT